MSGNNNSVTFQEGPAVPQPTATWLNAVDQVLFGSGASTTLTNPSPGNYVVFAGSGPTASRPAAPVQYSMYVDTDLKEPVWCTQVTPTIVWINASGEPV
jgi:hypothetical protein